MDSFTFKKVEKLCSQKIIGELFKTGNSLFCFPLKVIWIKADLLIPNQVQVALSVPKRNYKKSHDRNWIKRRIREAYRIHKNQLYEAMKMKDRKIALMILYIAKEKASFQEIETAVRKVILKLEKTPD